MANRAPTTRELERSLQTLANVCQQNFQVMSNNDRVLIDMAVTATVNLNAVMDYLKTQVDLEPFIQEVLRKREEAVKQAQEREAILKDKEKYIKDKMTEELNKAAGPAVSPVPQPEREKPLEFGGDFEESADVVGQDS